MAKFFFYVFMEQDEVKGNKHTKKHEANIQPSRLNKLVQ